MTCNICTNYLYFSCFFMCDMVSDSALYYNILVLSFPPNTDLPHYLDFFCVCLLVVLNILYKLLIWISCIVTGLGLWIQDSPDHLLLGVSCPERQKTGIEGPKPKANSTDLSGSWWQTKFFHWLKRMDWFSWSLLMCGSNLWGKFVLSLLFLYPCLNDQAAGVKITAYFKSISQCILRCVSVRIK